MTRDATYAPAHTGIGGIRPDAPADDPLSFLTRRDGGLPRLRATYFSQPFSR